MHVDFLVVGGGMAGVSVAAELVPFGSVALLEQEGELARHTTGRSAAVFLESYGSPEVRALTRASRPIIEAAGTDPLLSARPMIQVARADQEDRLAKEISAAPGLAPLDVREALELCPVLRPDYVGGAAVDHSAADIDVNGLHQHYVAVARRSGRAEIRKGATLLAGEYRGGRWQVETGAGEVRAGVVVDAAGAWADQVAERLGVAPVGLRPLRRTAAVCPVAVDPRGWPLVCDVDDEFYFRPEGGSVLVSPADETPDQPGDARPDELGVALALERVNAATTLGLRSVRTAWAGLRTFAPDRNPVVGMAADVPGFCWLAGQGGYGIQMAPALARLAAALITGASGTPAEGLPVERIAPTRDTLRNTQR
ncbi:glycerol-3-phosphate dehydrogenase [Longimycelium tulufanense]|uniref:Glycerol-3-phosphate dehydrogenase n=1 Tax=Longimycelium tulufanense TaxID=907463 RepID=A0A8J3CEI7_9PSEU|nr:FAD-binding oxidoreductase [Longimycelium tulufanense]GGM56937.1 glycerol-3-phosphate dehydrogenase [Longimycelium tulufanense]